MSDKGIKQVLDDIPMIEAAINWVTYKAYEIDEEKRNSLLSVLRLAQLEYNGLKSEIKDLKNR